MQNNCWNQIGVRGDRTCPELETVVHCQNCSVYSQTGRRLLERPAPEGYVAEWTTLLAEPRSHQQVDVSKALSMAIFRLGQEWLSLPAGILSQVLPPSFVHALPHCNNRILRGMVNVRGQLLLCVSLHELLGISSTESTLTNFAPGVPVRGASTPGKHGRYQRLVVIEQQRGLWAFEVNELYGLHRCYPEDLRNPPALSSKTLESFTQNILPWQDRNVSYLDAERLFEALRQKAL